jgi:arsenate reductase (thioredoxin)
MSDEKKQPTVLFVCVHNAGRSQMAAGFMTSLSGGKVRVLSAGSAPKETINPLQLKLWLNLELILLTKFQKF